MVADRSSVFEHLEVFVTLSWGGWLGRASVLGICMTCTMDFVVIVEVGDDDAVAIWHERECGAAFNIFFPYVILA